MALAFEVKKKRKSRKKTGLSQTEIRRLFAEASRWCSKNKAPGEPQYECVRKYMLEHLH